MWFSLQRQRVNAPHLRMDAMNTNVLSRVFVLLNQVEASLVSSNHEITSHGVKSNRVETIEKPLMNFEVD